MSLSDERANKLLDMFEALLGSDTGLGSEEKDTTLPYEILKFPEEEYGKEAWFLDPTTKMLVKIYNNTEVVRISDPDENGKVIIRYPNGFALVPKEYVIEIGFN